MKRRALGWLLLLASPGVASGLLLTLVMLGIGFPFTSPLRFDLQVWAVAALSSAAGGYLASANVKRLVLRLLASIGGFIFGAVMFALAMIAADYFSQSF